jgi:hypothetical protein
MLNVRGENVEDFASNCAQVEQILSGVQDIGTILNPKVEVVAVPSGMDLIQSELGGRVIAETGPVCPHGTMTLKSGGNWSAYMCPAQKTDPTKCQPIDAKTGKPWPKR